MKSIIQNKKGQVGDLFENVKILVLIAVLLGAGLLVLSQFTSSQFLTTATTKVNETGFVNSTGYTLADSATKRNFASPAIVTIINATDSTVVGAGNYTLTGNVVTNATAVNYPTVKITYTYNFDNDTAVTTATESAQTAIGAIANTWMAVIVAILMAGLVIFILVKAFTGYKK